MEIRQQKFDLAAIREVRIFGPSRIRAWVEPAGIRARPPNAAAAANSIPFAVAKTLCHGDLTLSDFAPDGLDDQAAITIANKVQCMFDDKIRGGIVEVINADRTTRSASVPIPLGHPTRPMPYENVLAKFRVCCRHAASQLISDRIQGMIELVENLEDVEDMSVLAQAASGSPI